MSYSKISRRDFIKMTTGAIGAAISIGLGLPVMSYLLSPALRDAPDESQTSLGPLANYPIGLPTPFDFVRTKQNGWEKTSINIMRTMSSPGFARRSAQAWPRQPARGRNPLWICLGREYPTSAKPAQSSSNSNFSEKWDVGGCPPATPTPHLIEKLPSVLIC